MDFQKFSLKLESIMANPDKLVVIPETPKEKYGFPVLEFVRNVMGSSAEAGSGEFHVYRHLRRKEYTRQKMIDENAEKEKLDEEFRRKLEENKRKMEGRTEKRRAKRLKKKQKRKQNHGTKAQENTEHSDSSSSESENENPSDLYLEKDKESIESNENSQEKWSAENVNSINIMNV